jgi:hypothetical protein
LTRDATAFLAACINAVLPSLLRRKSLKRLFNATLLADFGQNKERLLLRVIY